MNITAVISNIIKNNRSDIFDSLPYFAMDELEISIFSEIKKYYEHYGKLPGQSALDNMGLSHFYDSNNLYIDEDIEYVLDEFAKKCVTTRLLREIECIGQQPNVLKYSDGIKTINDLSKVALSFYETTEASNGHMDIFSTKEEFINLMSEENDSGLKLGFDKIDEDISVVPGNLVAIVGRTKIGKTLLMCYLAVKYAIEGHRVLVFSTEMTNKELMRRIYGFLIGINSKAFKTECKEKLSELHEEITQKINDIRASGGNIIMLPIAPTRFSEVVKHVDRYDINVVMADSIYHMGTDSGTAATDWRIFFELISGFKELSMGTGRSEKNEGKQITSFITSQLKRGSDGSGVVKITPDMIAYADSIPQTCDLVLGIRSGNTNDQRIIEVVIQRDGPFGAWQLVTLDFENSVIETWQKPQQTIINVGVGNV